MGRTPEGEERTEAVRWSIISAPADLSVFSVLDHLLLGVDLGAA